MTETLKFLYELNWHLGLEYKDTEAIKPSWISLIDKMRCICLNNLHNLAVLCEDTRVWGAGGEWFHYYDFLLN